MQPYFEIMDWQGLKLPSAERRQRDSLKSLNTQSKCGKTEYVLRKNSFLTQAQALLGKAIIEHTTQRNAEVKSIINKDRQVAPKQMSLGARLAVNTHNMRGRFVESVKNARWPMSPHAARDGLESIIEFQVQSKGHNQRE